jgi:hypothetical protein
MLWPFLSCRIVLPQTGSTFAHDALFCRIVLPQTGSTFAHDALSY